METKTEYSSESQSERTEAIRKACNGFLLNESSKDISCRKTKNLRAQKKKRSEQTDRGDDTANVTSDKQRQSLTSDKR